MSVKFSVVMAVYAKDRAEWFEQAIESVLNQSMPADDIVIVADGPLTKELDSSLARYLAKDTVSVIRLEKNAGLGNALNVGIKASKNELIARMDSDDIAVADRFRLQLEEFESKPDLGISGGQIAEFIDKPNQPVSYRLVPIKHADIVKFSKRRSPFNHPTVMFKKTIIDSLGGYSARAFRIEDYDLWLRAIHVGVECSNLGETLLYYRSTIDAVKRRKTLSSLKSHIKARIRFYRAGFIGLGDCLFGVSVQIILFIAPPSLAEKIFLKTVREVA